MGNYKMKFLVLAAILGFLKLVMMTSSTSSISTTPRCSTRETGLPTRSPDLMTTTAPSPSPTTGRVPNNVLSPGSAEALECAREADGAPVSTDAKDPLSLLRPPVSLTPTEENSI